MTVVGTGGVVISRWCKSKRFRKEYDKLDISLKDLVDQKLQDLVKAERPSGLGFEKLKGHADIYTIHVTGNYKISLEIGADAQAFLRRVGTHNEIDRQP